MKIPSIAGYFLILTNYAKIKDKYLNFRTMRLNNLEEKAKTSSATQVEISADEPQIKKISPEIVKIENFADILPCILAEAQEGFSLTSMAFREKLSSEEKQEIQDMGKKNLR